MEENALLQSRTDAVLTLTFNRPDKLNAMTDELLHAIADAFKQAERDESVRAIIVTGAGRGFCAGQDLASVQSREADAQGSLGYGAHLRETYNKVITRMRTIEKPIIAAVNGVAAGAGMSLVMACDLRVAADNASFLQAFIKIGLVPDSGSTWMLQRLIGQARATEMMLTGRKISAQEALDWGLINRVVPAANLLDEANGWANELAALPTRSVGYIKRAFNRASTSSLLEALEYEADMQELAGRTEDHKEGLAAFLEKRQAQYQGR